MVGLHSESNIESQSQFQSSSSSSFSRSNSAAQFKSSTQSSNRIPLDNPFLTSNSRLKFNKVKPLQHLQPPDWVGTSTSGMLKEDQSSGQRWNRIDRDSFSPIRTAFQPLYDVDSYKSNKYLNLGNGGRQAEGEGRREAPFPFQFQWSTSNNNNNNNILDQSSLSQSIPKFNHLNPKDNHQKSPSFYHKRPLSSLSQDDSLALLFPLLILFSTLLFMLLLFVILIVIVRKRSRISLNDSNSPIDVGREEDLESTSPSSGAFGLGGIPGIEERWLETVSQSIRTGYLRSKDFLLTNPPNSTNTDITLQQYLSIQEKGVSAWSFEPDYESNPSVLVENRTEIRFLEDGVGMTLEEGGGVNVQSNLPLPKLNEVYYWEAKMFTLPEGCNVSVGLATKPFPSFRLPGWSKYSIGYFSQDGFKSHNYPFFSQSYGPSYVQGDVIGCGYRPRTGTVFFTRNGKKLEDAFIGLNRYNLFPTIGSNNLAEIHINLGQAGFVFIEANVKNGV